MVKGQHCMFFSDAYLQFADFLQSLLNQSDYRLPSVEYFNKTTQTESMQSAVFGMWKNKWYTPFQTILTKWGFCFSFNLMPLEKLFRLEK
jgi:hypothetical protein